MKGVIADLKHAFRIYRRTPGASAIAIVVLAVAMAFVGAFLSLYVDLVLRGHPGIEDSGRIVTLGQTDGARLMGVPLGLIERMGGELTSLEAVAGVESTSLAVGPEAEMRPVEIPTRGFFEGIRPKLLMGRGFESTDHDDGAEPVAVISEAYWREELGSRPDVLGTTLEIGRPQFTIVNASSNESNQQQASMTEFRIVGVMSPEMTGLMGDDVVAWAPFETIIPIILGALQGLSGNANANAEADAARRNALQQMRRTASLRSLGRRSAGASADAIVAEINSRYPESTEDFTLQTGFRIDAIDGVVRNFNVHRETRRQLQLFLAGSILLAVVAGANVSLFLLARAPGRRRELGIRMSVGAPMKRLARQLASEAGLLVVVSAALGLLMSVWLGNSLRGLAFLREAEWGNVTLLDWRVLGLAGVFLLVLTLLVSLAPILGLKRLGIAASSRQVAARASLAQRIAGTVQIAIAGALGGAAIAFGWYLGSIVLGYAGYETRNLHAVQIAQFQMDQASGRVTFFQSGRIDAASRREAIESIPGVTAAAFGTPIPGQGSATTRTIEHPLDAAQEIEIQTGNVDAGFVELLGFRLRYGRGPAEADVGVALVNETLARRFFGRDNVVGESLPLATQGGQRSEIIGVLEDLSFEHPAADAEPLVLLVGSPSNSNAVIESTMTAAMLEQRLQELVDSGGMDGVISSVQPLKTLRDNLIAPDTARSWLTIGTATLVVLLAAFGFYGTQRYLVAAGRREYAIRASLGAGPKALGRLVFRRGLMLSLPGLVVGSLLAFIVVAWLRDSFVSRDISPSAVTVAVLAGLALLLLAASSGPARQARRTQPAPLLRED